MPNARIGNTVANSRALSTTPVAYTSMQVAHGRIRGTLPNVLVRSFQTGILTPASSSTIFAGTPIGLLLALTYANNVVTMTDPVYRGDSRPNVRIMNV